MTSETLGANPDQLRSLAQSMGTSSQTISAADQTITALLSGIPWNGGDADRFRDRWHSIFRIQLNQAATTLSDQSRLLVDQADQQEQTSNDGGGGPAGPMVPASQTSDSDGNFLDTFLNFGGDMGGWPPYQIANWVTSAGGFGSERLLSAMRSAGLLTSEFGTAPGIGYLRGTQALNALNMAGKFAGGLSVFTGLGQTYQGIQSGDGHVIADGAITTILAAGSLTPTP
ncbi:hypothetical protein, partial [Arthrobacter sp. H5]|uniref:hypothetical protein n=1 Tax=Arthrobacter sp. H5 TaxID=1267973 RepID=UPI0004833735